MEIELAENTYTIDLNDDKSIQNAIVSEIKYLHTKYGIETNRTSVSAYDKYNDKSLKQISYYASYDTYLTNRTITGSRKESTVENIKELITKVIKKCEQKRQANIEKQTENNDFQKFVHNQFDRYTENIEFIQNYEKTDIAEITCRDGIVIKMYQNYETYISRINDKESAINFVEKLLR